MTGTAKDKKRDPQGAESLGPGALSPGGRQLCCRQVRRLPGHGRTDRARAARESRGAAGRCRWPFRRRCRCMPKPTTSRLRSAADEDRHGRDRALARQARGRRRSDCAGASQPGARRVGGGRKGVRSGQSALAPLSGGDVSGRADQLAAVSGRQGEGRGKRSAGVATRHSAIPGRGASAHQPRSAAQSGRAGRNHPQGSCSKRSFF